MAIEYNDIYPLLDVIENAAKPLQPYLSDNLTSDQHSPTKLFEALNESLSILGLADSFSKDDAGLDILDELRQMQAAAIDSAGNAGIGRAQNINSIFQRPKYRSLHVLIRAGGLFKPGIISDVD